MSRPDARKRSQAPTWRLPSKSVSFHRQLWRACSISEDQARSTAARSNRFGWGRLLFILSLIVTLSASSDVGAVEPVDATGTIVSLHERIDTLLDAAHIGPVAKQTDDGEFLRRLSLDLIGRLPTLVERDQFASEPADERRGKWIDRLLASPECDKYLAVVLDVTWMERRPDFYVPTHQWRDYLRQSLAKGQPLNELVAEILGATGANEADKARSKFLVDRNVESHLLTRDVGRMFFGRDLQCAQCHDHPLISDYSQDEYYGLFAFMQRSFLVTMDVDKKLVSVGEKADGDAEFASVFEPDIPKRTALPSLPDGGPVVEEPSLSPADAYLVAPDDKIRSVPRFSRREQLAAANRLAESRMFRRNAANRIWRLLMKRGFVEPPDLMHSGNPASHPLLLDELADWLAAKQFSVKAVLAEVARTQAYQRQVDLPPLESIDPIQVASRVDQWKTAASYQNEVVKRIDADLSAARSRRIELEKQITVLRAALQQKLNEHHAASLKHAEATAKLQAVETDLQQKRTALAALQTSAQQAQAAATQLPSDTELSAAAQLLASRVQSLTEAVPPLEQQLSPLQQAVKEAADRVAAMGNEVAVMRPQADALALQVKEQGGIQQLLQRQQLSESARAVEWTQRIAYAEQLAAWSQIAESVQQLEQSFARLREEVQLREADRAALDEQRKRLDHELAEPSKSCEVLEVILANIDRLLMKTQSHLAQTEAVIASLAQASTTTGATAVSSGPPAGDASRLDPLRANVVKLTQQREKVASTIATLKMQSEVKVKERTALQEAIHSAQLRCDELQQRLSEAESQLTQRRAESDRAAQRIRGAWTQRFVVASLQGLSPEQLAASAVVGLGLDQRFRAEATAEWQEKNKDKKPEEIPAEQRSAEIEAMIQQRSQQVDATFVSLFAGAPGSPQDVFQATVDQALFWANDGRVHNWVAPTGRSLAEQLIALPDNRVVIDRAYRSLLGRLPDAGELERMDAFLGSSQADRPRAIQDLIWSLLTSVEFRFNH